jgi:hypothetical protein
VDLIEKIIIGFEERSKTLVELPNPPHWGGLPRCPFARLARLKKMITWAFTHFNPDQHLNGGSLIVGVLDRWLAKPGWKVLWFIDPDVTMPYEVYLRFFTRLAAYLPTRACSGFAGHPENPL